MNQKIFTCWGDSPALPYSCQYFENAGFCSIDHPAPEVRYLLTDTPCRKSLEGILERLPEDVTVIGGNLAAFVPAGTNCIDLLQYEPYLWQNAAITARCALRLACGLTDRTLNRLSILIVGFGRIGIHLANILNSLGAAVSVAARSSSARAMALSFGCHPVPITAAAGQNYDIVFNTVPFLLYDSSAFPGSCIIDLASKPGISGDNVIAAKGLPGKMASKSSGQLIASQAAAVIQGGSL